MWPVLSSVVKSRSPGKLTTRERSFKIKSLSIQFRENIDFYMYCWYQRLAFSERRGMPATDTHTARLPYASVAPPSAKNAEKGVADGLICQLEF